MLADKIRHYQEIGEVLSVTPAKYKSQYEWLKEVDSLSPSQYAIKLTECIQKIFQTETDRISEIQE